METTNTPAVNAVENQAAILPAEIEKKANQWRNMGIAIANTEMELQVSSQATIKKLITPTSIETVIDAENSIKVAKKEYAAIQEKRKAITSRFDSVSARLAENEKSILAAISPVEAEIIKFKKIDADNKTKLQNKAIELRAIKENFINHITKCDTAYKQAVADQVAKCYNYALGAGNIGLGPDGEIDHEYLAKCRGWFKSENFSIVCPIFIISFNTNEECKAIWDAIEIKTSKFYYDIYEAALNQKFAFYSVALKDKEAALQVSKEAEDRAKAELLKEESAKQTAAKLESIATTYNPTVSGAEIKALKQVYEIELEDTKEFAIKVMAAFIGNLALCEGGVRASWLKLSVTQMASAIEWAKKADENFECGLPFKIVEKL
jgi:hypothetical protein